MTFSSVCIICYGNRRLISIVPSGEKRATGSVANVLDTDRMRAGRIVGENKKAGVDDARLVSLSLSMEGSGSFGQLSDHPCKFFVLLACARLFPEPVDFFPDLRSFQF